MGKFQQIEQEVKDAIKNGASIAAVKQGLLNGGYNNDDISDILSSIQSPKEPVITPKPVTSDPVKKEELKPFVYNLPKEEMNTPVVDKPEDKVEPKLFNSDTPKESINDVSKEATQQSNPTPVKMDVTSASTPATLKESSVPVPEKKESEINLDTDLIKKQEIQNNSFSPDPTLNKAPALEKPQSVPSTPQVSTPINNPFGNTTVGTNVVMQEKPIMNQSEPVITEDPIKEKKGGIFKFVLVIFIILLIGAGAVFGYSKYDPFFLKSKEDILRSIISNTQNRLADGGYSLSSTSNYEADYGDIATSIEVPIVYKAEKAGETKFPDQSLDIGDIDLTPVFEAINQMFMVFAVEDETMEDTSIKGNDILNIGLKYSEGVVYLILNKIPDDLYGFIPVDQFIGTWISFNDDNVEDLVGYEVPETDTVEVQKFIDDMVDIILVKSEPEITTSKEGDNRRITYKALMSKFILAINEKEFEGDWDNDSEYKIQQDEMIKQLEKISGEISIDLLVGNDFITREFNISFLGEDLEEGIKGSASIKGIFGLGSEININAPESFITLDEVQGIIMMNMMGDMDLTNTEIEQTI